MSTRNSRLVLIAGWASVLTAIVLMAIKLVAWLMTDSAGLLASLIDSLMDGVASLLNLVALRYALQPPDDNHRFGHGKAEALAGLAQSTFIIGSAVFLLLHAVGRLLHPSPLSHPEVGMTVMVLSMALTSLLVLFQRYVVRQTGSVAVGADSFHYLTDLLTNLGVLVAIWLVTLGIGWLDPAIALVIGLYILWGAARIGYESVQLLLDHELPDRERDLICEQVLAHEGVMGLHNLRTRRSGVMRIIQLDLEMPAELPLREAHRISSSVKQSLRRLYPDSDVTIHQDPVGGVIPLTDSAPPPTPSSSDRKQPAP